MTAWQWASLLGIAALLALLVYALLPAAAAADSPEQRREEHYLADARRMRLAMVSAAWLAGEITEEQARELLRGPLRPGDPTTVVDDSRLLGMDAQRAWALCGLPPGRRVVP